MLVLPTNHSLQPGTGAPGVFLWVLLLVDLGVSISQLDGNITSEAHRWPCLPVLRGSLFLRLELHSMGPRKALHNLKSCRSSKQSVEQQWISHAPRGQ